MFAFYTYIWGVLSARGKNAHVRWVIAQTPKAFQSVADTCWIEHVFLNWREMLLKSSRFLLKRVGAVWSLNGEVAFLHLKRFTCASETRGPWKDSNLSRPQLVVTEPTYKTYPYISKFWLSTFQQCWVLRPVPSWANFAVLPGLWRDSKLQKRSEAKNRCQSHRSGIPLVTPLGSSALLRCCGKFLSDGLSDIFFFPCIAIWSSSRPEISEWGNRSHRKDSLRGTTWHLSGKVMFKFCLLVFPLVFPSLEPIPRFKVLAWRFCVADVRQWFL